MILHLPKDHFGPCPVTVRILVRKKQAGLSEEFPDALVRADWDHGKWAAECSI
jgi:hypothetical protein